MKWLSRLFFWRVREPEVECCSCASPWCAPALIGNEQVIYSMNVCYGCLEELRKCHVAPDGEM